MDIHLDLLRPHGVNISTSKLSSHTRLILQNTQDIYSRLDPAFEVTAAAKEYRAGIYGVNERNCVMDDHIFSAINANTKKHFGRGYVTAASTLIKTSGYLPRGVMKLIRGNVAGRHHSMGRDPLGKFLWTTLRGKSNNLLCIITVYRVCQKKGTKPAA
jgi:hypothetical protein